MGVTFALVELRGEAPCLSTNCTHIFVPMQVSLDPPIRQGHAVYPHVLFQFPIGDEIVVDDINIPSYDHPLRGNSYSFLILSIRF